MILIKERENVAPSFTECKKRVIAIVTRLQTISPSKLKFNSIPVATTSWEYLKAKRDFETFF